LRYEDGSFSELTRNFVDMADLVNAYIAEKAPWVMAKDESQRQQLHEVCTFALSAFRLLSGVLKPILPVSVEAAEQFLAAPIVNFDDARRKLCGHVVNAFDPLLSRIDGKRIEAMVDASKDSLAATPSPPNPPLEGEGLKRSAAVLKPSPEPRVPSPGSLISIDDFAKLDLRIGKVLHCGFVDGSDKLLRFELDAGELGKRQIFSGIRASYTEPEKLIGRNVVFIANLAPRKMRFGVSEGMILSAGSGSDNLFLLDADQGAQPGMPIK
jgi:methionyl-tRNA synthetase